MVKLFGAVEDLKNQVSLTKIPFLGTITANYI